MTTLASFRLQLCYKYLHFQEIPYFFLAMGRRIMMGKTCQKFLLIGTSHDMPRSGEQVKVLVDDKNISPNILVGYIEITT